VQQALQTLVATATQNQWEGATPRGPPPTREQMLYHMGQGRKGVSTGGPGLGQGATKADHEWVRLRQGIAIKVAMLTRLDTKDVVECSKMMIAMVRGKLMDANEDVRSRVATRMLDHLEAAADRRQEGAAGRNLEDVCLRPRVDHQDVAGARCLVTLGAGGARRFVDRR